MKRFFTVLICMVLVATVVAGCGSGYHNDSSIDNEPSFEEVWRIVVNDRTYNSRAYVEFEQLNKIDYSTWAQNRNSLFVEYRQVPYPAFCPTVFPHVSIIAIMRNKSNIPTSEDYFFIAQPYGNIWSLEFIYWQKSISSITLHTPSVRVIDNTVEVYYRGEVYAYMNAEFRVYHFAEIDTA